MESDTASSVSGAGPSAGNDAMANAEPHTHTGLDRGCAA